jgi:flagellar basal-body rod protein FlgB
MSLLDTTQLALESAMRGSMLRQTLLTNNLANVDTPGYQRQDVDFQGALDQALKNGQPVDQVTFQPFTQQQTLQADGNGVSPEQESANLAENGMLYEELTAVAAQRNAILKSAMGVG